MSGYTLDGKGARKLAIESKERILYRKIHENNKSCFKFTAPSAVLS